MEKTRDRDASPVRGTSKPEKIWIVSYIENDKKCKIAYTTREQADEMAIEIMEGKAWIFSSTAPVHWKCRIKKISIKDYPLAAVRTIKWNHSKHIALMGGEKER